MRISSTQKQKKKCKKSMFCIFNRILRFEEAYYKSEICDWGYSNVSGTIWKNCSSETWEIWNFSSFVPMFYPSLSEIKHSHLNKYAFLKLARQRLSYYKGLMCYL